MTSPIDPPEGNWWSEPVNRRESIWLGIAGVWSLFLFSWMSGWVRAGDQNPTGDTYKVPPDQFRERVAEYKEAAEETDDGLIPNGEDVYIAGERFRWDGLPVVLETNTRYDFHFSSYDVQHATNIRPEHNLSAQMNFDILPGYEWVVPMEFDEPGTYHVICSEFCGDGHRSMHGSFTVVESE